MKSSFSLKLLSIAYFAQIYKDSRSMHENDHFPYSCSVLGQKNEILQMSSSEFAMVWQIILYKCIIYISFLTLFFIRMIMSNTWIYIISFVHLAVLWASE